MNASLHDHDYELESGREFAISETIADRLIDLQNASGHAKEEQEAIESALSMMLEKETDSAIFYRYLFDLWKYRGAKKTEDREKKYRAADAIGNLLGLAVREFVSSEVRREFEA